MTDVQFRSDMTVRLVSSTDNCDLMVCMAAKVSTLGTSSLWDMADDKKGQQGLINFLVKNRHGSPLEHNQFTFQVEAPIFVWREIMRHRIASYNEESGRYKQLDPVFYVPDENRPLQQVGKAGAYDFVPGTERQYDKVNSELRHVSETAYDAYQDLLDEGVAREVARMVLPLNIYSSAYVTMNARGLMNFFSLRVRSEKSAYPSFPQREIEMVAEAMEAIWTLKMPMVSRAFEENGRVAP